MRFPTTSRRSSRHSFGLLETGLTIAGSALAAYFVSRAAVRQRRKVDLQGKVAVVAGGSTGIGFCIARELVERGAKVAICARHERELRRAQEKLERDGSSVFAAVCDITQPDQVENFVGLVRGELGPVEVLVNNAGTIVVGPISHMDLGDFQHTMDINFYGPLHMLLTVMPEMREQGHGRIINITSFGGKVPVPHMATYAASKFAFVGLSETLRTELIDDGIYVTTVCPGLVRAGSTPNALFKGQHDKEKALFETMANTPLLTISPERLARRIVDAMVHGDAELVTPWVASVQTFLHAVAPTWSSEMISLLNGLLPSRSKSPAGDRRRSGDDIDTGDLTPKHARASETKAEQRYQHRDPGPQPG